VKSCSSQHEILNFKEQQFVTLMGLNDKMGVIFDGTRRVTRGSKGYKAFKILLMMMTREQVSTSVISIIKEPLLSYQKGVSNHASSMITYTLVN
jgi:hypothetical protein